MIRLTRARPEFPAQTSVGRLVICFVWHIFVTAGRHRAEYISGESINRARWTDG